jgi:hypothetical protein
MRALPIIVAALVNFGCSLRSDLPVKTASEMSCVPFGGAPANERWLTGNYKVMPVTAEHQAQMMRRLKHGAVKEVRESVAKAMTGGTAPPNVTHYYLVRIGYVGDASPGTVPVGVNMSADVDNEGVAYLTTFRLGSSLSTSEFAAVLVSPTPIKRVVSTCGAAE